MTSVNPVMGTGRAILAWAIRTDEHPDLRGSVTETYRESWIPNAPPVKQLVQSQSRAKTLRGMHFHKKQWDFWRFTDTRSPYDGVVREPVIVRLYDHRSGEQDFVEASSDLVLAIPPGISHGFYTPRGCTLVYGLTEEYDGTDEYGWLWTDGLPAEHPWPKPDDDILISMRDISAPRLAGFTAE